MAKSLATWQCQCVPEVNSMVEAIFIIVFVQMYPIVTTSLLVHAGSDVTVM